MPFPRKKLLGALRSALAAKLADGKLTVVDSLEIKEAKTKLYRKALDKLGVNAHRAAGGKRQDADRRRWCWARATWKGVELVLNNEVHPYDLLRYERAIFSQGRHRAADEALEKIASKRS